MRVLALLLLLAASDEITLEPGKCYRYTMRYKPRLTDAQWAAVLRFHTQFRDLGGEPKVVHAERSTQTVRYELVQRDRVRIKARSEGQATYLPIPGVTVETIVRPCEVAIV